MSCDEKYDGETKEILSDTENLLKKITHKVCDILIGSGRKKLEKICSDPDVTVHYDDKKSKKMIEVKNE